MNESLLTQSLQTPFNFFFNYRVIKFPLFQLVYKLPIINSLWTLTLHYLFILFCYFNCTSNTENVLILKIKHTKVDRLTARSGNAKVMGLNPRKSSFTHILYKIYETGTQAVWNWIKTMTSLLHQSLHQTKFTHLFKKEIFSTKIIAEKHSTKLLTLSCPWRMVLKAFKCNKLDLNTDC